jgi:hypothetical protein
VGHAIAGTTEKAKANVMPALRCLEWKLQSSDRVFLAQGPLRAARSPELARRFLREMPVAPVHQRQNGNGQLAALRG